MGVVDADEPYARHGGLRVIGGGGTFVLPMSAMGTALPVIAWPSAGRALGGAWRRCAHGMSVGHAKDSRPRVYPSWISARSRTAIAVSHDEVATATPKSGKPPLPLTESPIPTKSRIGVPSPVTTQ
jgi:hypothetical protein